MNKGPKVPDRKCDRSMNWIGISGYECTFNFWYHEQIIQKVCGNIINTWNIREVKDSECIFQFQVNLDNGKWRNFSKHNLIHLINECYLNYIVDTELL